MAKLNQTRREERNKSIILIEICFPIVPTSKLSKESGENVL